MGRYKKKQSSKNDTIVIESVELDEALKPKDKKVIDAFYRKDSLEGGLLSTDGKSLEKHGVGGQTIAAWLDGKIAITAVSDVKSTEEILRYMKKSIPKNNFDQKSYKKFFGEEVETEESELTESTTTDKKNTFTILDENKPSSLIKKNQKLL